MAEKQRGTFARALVEHAVRGLITRYLHPEHGTRNLVQDAELARRAGQVVRDRATEAGAAAVETTRQVATRTSERADHARRLGIGLFRAVRQRYFSRQPKA